VPEPSFPVILRTDVLTTDLDDLGFPLERLTVRRWAVQELISSHRS
jgi:hypothetical protein